MKHLIQLALIALIFPSCSKDDENSGNGKINSTISVTIIEGLSESKNTLNILSETMAQQPCSNYGLICSYEKEANYIKITYKGINQPEICLTATGPARTGISYDLTNGTYDIEFINDDISNLATLLVDDEKYTIQMLSENNVILKRNILYKIPQKTYWGTIGYHQEASLELVEEFIDLLKQEGANFKLFKNGDYGYFTISSEEIQAPLNHGYYFVKAIVFEHDGEFEPFKNAVLQYADTNKDLLSIYLTNYQGNEINLWN